MSDMKVHVLPAGVMECDLRSLLCHGDGVFADHAHKDETPSWGECPTHAVLIETSACRILWDTGIPRDWATRWAPKGYLDYFPVNEHALGSGYIDDGLAGLGLVPEDIDILLLSHLHYDHAGNAKLFGGGATRILAQAAEIAAADAATGHHDDSYLLDDFEGLPLEAIDGDAEIVPGVSVIHTPGHTPGMMSLRVDLPRSGTKIFTSDAVYLGSSYGPPAVGSAFMWDAGLWADSVEKLRRIQEESNAEMFFGHDADQLRRMKLAPTGWYS